MKAITNKQKAVLRVVGVEEMPEGREEAQRQINKHFAPKSKRGWNGRRANRERKAAQAKKLPSSVVVRFECPVCGGPHAKADHA